MSRFADGSTGMEQLGVGVSADLYGVGDQLTDHVGVPGTPTSLRHHADVLVHCQASHVAVQDAVAAVYHHGHGDGSHRGGHDVAREVTLGLDYFPVHCSGDAGDAEFGFDYCHFPVYCSGYAGDVLLGLNYWHFLVHCSGDAGDAVLGLNYCSWSNVPDTLVITFLGGTSATSPSIVVIRDQIQ